MGVIHVVANHLEDLTPWLATLSTDATDIMPLANADEVRQPVMEKKPEPRVTSPLARLLRDAPETRQDLERLTFTETARRALPGGRNFH